MRNKKTLSLILALLIMTSSLMCCPLSVFAKASTVTKAIIYNPLTENREDEIFEEYSSYSTGNEKSSSGKIIYDNPLEAAKVLRDSLVNREAVISLKYYYPNEFNDSNETGIPLSEKLFFMALDENISVSSVDGDYLKRHWGRYKAQSSQNRSDDGRYYCTVTYTMTYYTTLEEEQELTEKINADIPKLKLNEKSDYLKIKAIHNYICESTNYDYVTLEDTTNKYKYTAYGTLVQGYGVCQGYASLFTRLCKENNLEARTISGDNHAWNIVKLGDKFYNVDTTWDDSNYDRPNDPDGNYWSDKYSDYWLLRGSTDFGGHTPEKEYAEESFWKPYPMAESKYVCPHNVTYVSVVKEPTCTEDGYTTYTCSNCNDTYTDDVKGKLGHDFGTNNKTCANCGIDNPEYVEPVPAPSPGGGGGGGGGGAPAPTPEPETPEETEQKPETTPTPKPTPTTPSNAITYKGETIKPNTNGEYVSKKAKRPAISKLTKGRKAFKITWKKISGVSGYQIQYSTSKKFTKKTTKAVYSKGNKKFAKTIKNLKGAKKYYVRIRTYKIVNGKKIFSTWSKVKTVVTTK